MVTTCVYTCGPSILVFAPGLRRAQDVHRCRQSVSPLGVTRLSAPPTQTSVPLCLLAAHAGLHAESLHFNARLAIFLQDISWLPSQRFKNDVVKHHWGLNLNVRLGFVPS